MAELFAVLAFLGLIHSTSDKVPNADPCALRDIDITLGDRDFIIPVEYNKTMRPTIQALHLYVSTDSGKTWDNVQTITSERDQFVIRARSNGEYWFALQIVDKNEKRQPVKISIKTVRQIVKVQVIAPIKLK